MEPPVAVHVRPKRRASWFAPFLLWLLLAAVLVGCLRAPEPTNPTTYDDEYLSGPPGEPVEVTYTFPGDSQPTLLTAELVDGVVLIEGDIALGTLEELLAAAAAPRTQSHGVASMYWPASTATPPYEYEVPYVIADDFSDDYVQNVILPAIQHWNDATNLRWVERDDETDYVEFVTATNRCWSSAGRQTDRQEIRLDESGCTRVATVVHEMGHAIGLKHEQQRSDRDDFVEILWNNIDPTKVGNFSLYGSGLPLGAYGYTSVMHYSRTAFGLLDDAGNRLTTIRTLGDTIRPSARLTDGDLAGVRRLYPETDLPFADITEPPHTITVDEGELVTFGADVVIAPTLDEADLVLSWSYERAGVPFTFASAALGEGVTHRFCDGVHDVDVSASVPSQGELASDTVRVIVNDLGMTGPPAMCQVSIAIDEPLDGAVYPEGATISLAAVIDDDHPETDDPLYPVTWRLDDPQSGSIVGTGLRSSTKLGAGQHTIYVTYGAAVDAVTVTVEEAGTPPSASIFSPADESVHDWFVLDGTNPYLDIAFSGSANDAQDGALAGNDLMWEVRREGVGSYVQRGTGADPVLRFPMEVNTVRYDVRLTATDADGMKGTTTIQIVIVWPPS